MAEPAEQVAQEPTKQEQPSEDIAGLIRNRDEILNEKRQLKEQFDQLRSEYEKTRQEPKEIFGKPVEQVEKILKHFENNEEAQKIADGKWDEVIESRTSQMRREFEKKEQSYTSELEQLKQQLNQTASERDKIFVETQVRNAVGSKAYDSAVPDILRRANEMFQRDENGDLVAKKGEDIVYGRDGRTPLTPSEWVETILPEEAPHYFPAMSGGGERNGPSRGGKGPILVTREEMEDPEFFRRTVEEADKRGVDIQYKQ